MSRHSSSALLKRRCCPECGTVTASEEITAARGNLTIDRALRRCTWRGAQVRLTPQMFDILETLVQREGRVVQDWAFYIRVIDEDVETNVLDIQISKIRTAFRKADPEFDQIETVRGEGFLWRRATEEALKT